MVKPACLSVSASWCGVYGLCQELELELELERTQASVAKRRTSGTNLLVRAPASAARHALTP